MTDDEETVAKRIRALRKAVNKSQDQVADDGGFERTYMNKIENGANTATSYKIRDGLARGFDVPLEPLAEYLDGKLPLESLLALRGMRSTSNWWRGIAARARISLSAHSTSRPEHDPGAGVRVPAETGCGKVKSTCHLTRAL